MDKLATLIIKTNSTIDDIDLEYGDELCFLLLLLVFTLWIWRNTRNEFRLYVLHKAIFKNCYRQTYRTPKGAVSVLAALKNVIIPILFLLVLLSLCAYFIQFSIDIYTYYKTNYTEFVVISEKPVIVKSINKSIEQTFSLEEDITSKRSIGEIFKMKIKEPNQYNRSLQITLPHWIETLQLTIAFITLIFMIKTIKNVFSPWAKPYFQKEIHKEEYDLVIDEKKEKLWIIILVIAPFLFVAYNSL